MTRRTLKSTLVIFGVKIGAPFLSWFNLPGCMKPAFPRYRGNSFVRPYTELTAYAVHFKTWPLPHPQESRNIKNSWHPDTSEKGAADNGARCASPSFCHLPNKPEGWMAWWVRSFSHGSENRVKTWAGRHNVVRFISGWLGQPLARSHITSTTRFEESPRVSLLNTFKSVTCQHFFSLSLPLL